MSRWGLMRGLGRGIREGAQMLNAGMAEDRANRRQDERDQRREELEVQRQKVLDEQWAATMAMKKEQFDANREDNNAYREATLANQGRQIDLSERQVGLTEEKHRQGTVESVLDKIEQERTEREAQVARFYSDRRDELSMALESMDITEEQKQAIHQQIQAEEAQMVKSLTQLRQDYEAQLYGAIDDVGTDKLKGTKWEPLISKTRSYKKGLMQEDPNLGSYVSEQIQNSYGPYGSIAGEGPVPGFPAPQQNTMPRIGTHNRP